MKKSRLMSSFVVFTLTANLVACGTILYPERKGLHGGKIDPVVAGLDAIGLFFYIVPGVIAFVVDYNSGAIYLPRGRRRSALDSELSVVHANQVIDDQYLEEVLKNQLHVDADLQSRNVIAKRVASLQSVKQDIVLY